MNDSVSVIIPTYNRPQSLSRAIKSVLIQTHTNYEILVINDSDDEKPVLEVIEKFKDSRIKYFKNERVKGGNGARNTGILNSKGKYVAFLDDDDEWLPDKIKNQIKYLSDKKNDYSGVFSAFLLQKKNRWIAQSYNIDCLKIRNFLTDRIGIGSSSNLIFDREVFKDIGIWDEELQRQQDLEFLVRFLSKYKMAFDDKIGLKVFGHNPPNPQKSFNEREKYLARIQKFVNALSIKDQKIYYSLHYRRQIGCLIKLREFKKAFDYYKIATKNEIILYRKDVKNVLLLIQSFFTIQKTQLSKNSSMNSPHKN